jgi:PEP phosphonomutase and related enzymes
MTQGSLSKTPRSAPSRCAKHPLLGGNVITTTYSEKISRFHELHKGPQILLLPNAWDVTSARIFSKLGFQAIATTSAGIANCLGYRDGENIPLDEMLFMIQKIVAAVDLPVTADLEAGYSDDPKQLAANIRSVIDLGVVGINLEDSFPSGALKDCDLQSEKIKAARNVASSVGVNLFINARVDTYLRSVAKDDERLQDTIARAHSYTSAGASGIFIPSVTNEQEIKALVTEIRAPINILATSKTPSVPSLERLGVARVSVGSGPARASVTLTRRIATELIEQGTYTSFTDAVMTNNDMNRFFDTEDSTGVRK